VWQKRYFVLEYPFLDIYDKKGGKRKGRISMRGGILIDEVSKVISLVLSHFFVQGAL
jgi:hypothetical protein